MTPGGHEQNANDTLAAQHSGKLCQWGYTRGLGLGDRVSIERLYRYHQVSLSITLVQYTCRMLQGFVRYCWYHQVS